MAKNIIDELMAYRVKVERNGREILNFPGILALPGALIAPKASIIGTVAASLLGCDIHLESEDGKSVDVGAKVREAADTVADRAKTAARTVRKEVDKAWDALSADDPEGCPLGEENEEETDVDASGADSAEDTAEDNPVIHVKDPVKPDDKEEL